RGRVVLASVPAKAGAAKPTDPALRAAIARGDAADVAAYDDAVRDEPLLPALPAPGRVTRTVVDTMLGTTTWTLSNGMRVVVKPTDFKADEVLVSAFSPGGTSLVSDADALAAGFAPFAVTAGGAGRFDAVALQKKLSGTTVDLTPYIAEMTEGFVGSVSPRELEPLLQLLHLYFTAPRRDSVAYAALQRNFHTSLANRDLSPAAAFNDTIAVTLAQHHPRRRPLTAARIDSVPLDRALQIYRERFHDAGDFTVVFVGAVHPDSLRPFAERYLASLPSAGRVERGRDVGVHPPATRVERIVRRGVEPQSSTAMVFTSDFEFTPENRLALGAMDAVLEIRLRERLREALGATYGVSVSAAASKTPREEASLSVRFGSAPERADELVQAVLAELDSLRRGGPRAEEMAKVKETMLRERETNLRENGYWLSRLETTLQLGEDPRSAILGAESRVHALTADQVRDAARKWVDPSRFVRVTLVPER
ncbi:MAG TPA: insulinase family protein, partial [Gemmatimonadaceae bacterium]|nr:insulinase family protein [Gemmatimonadaceae bacterium]